MSFSLREAGQLSSNNCLFRVRRMQGWLLGVLDWQSRSLVLFSVTFLQRKGKPPDTELASHPAPGVLARSSGAWR